MHSRRLAFLVALALLPGPLAVGQERVVAAVDDSPSAALLVEQAADQSRANRREAVLLLARAIDEGPYRLVPVPGDDGLFLPVVERVRRLLRADPDLAAAYRREFAPDAERMLRDGELDAVAVRRFDTEAGLEATLRLAESALSRGEAGAAACMLARAAGHPALEGARARSHASLARVAEQALTALDAQGDGGGGILAADPAGPWVESWATFAVGTEAYELDATDAAGMATAAMPGESPVSDGREAWIAWPGWVRSLDPVGASAGRSIPVGAAGDVFGLGLVPAGRSIALRDGSIYAIEGDVEAAIRSSPELVMVDVARGTVRGRARLDAPAGPRIDAVPSTFGTPVPVDATVAVPVRRATPRQEVVERLVGIDASDPGSPPWTTLLSSVGTSSVGQESAFNAPVASRGTLFCATGNGVVAAVEASDGRIRWLRRFPIPVRVRSLVGRSPDASSPAVGGGRVLALAPDRSAIRAFDAWDGAALDEFPTGVGTPLGSPRRLVGDPRSGLVMAVGGRVACVSAADPRSVLWSTPVADGEIEPGLEASVTWIRRSGDAPPIAAVPSARDVELRDGRSGAVLGRVPGAGGSAVVGVGSAVVGVSDGVVRTWMDPKEAERSARLRLAATDAPEGAFPLLSLGRRTRNAAMVIEAASAAAERTARTEAGDPARTELADALARAERLDLGDAGQRARIDELADRAAELAGRGLAVAMARADRSIRRGAAADGIRIAIVAAVATEPGETTVIGDLEQSSLAAALDRVRAAVAADPASASSVTRAVDEASRAAAGDAGRERRALVAGALAAAGPEQARIAADRLVRASGTDEERRRAQAFAWSLPGNAPAPDQVADPMGVLAAGSRPQPSITGSPGQPVEFPGVLLRVGPGASQPSDGVLTLDRGSLALRRAPRFAAAWTAPVGFAQGSLVASNGSFVVADDGPGGTGAVACVSGDGTVKWTIEAAGPGAAADPLADALREPGDPESVPQVIATAPCLVRVDRDGSVAGHDWRTGAVLWRRAGGTALLAEAEAGATVVALAVGPSDEGREGASIEFVDARDGASLGTHEPEGASTVAWVRALPGGCFAFATDRGLGAAWLADPARPAWINASVELASSPRAWTSGRWLVVCDRDGEVRAFDGWTGRESRERFGTDGRTRVGEPGPLAMIRGDGWCALRWADAVQFYSVDGASLGSDALGPDRAPLAVAAAKDRVIALEGSAERDPAPLRFGATLWSLDARSGGMVIGRPLRIRALGRPFVSVGVAEGTVLVGNGGSIQAIPFGNSSGQSP